MKKLGMLLMGWSFVLLMTGLAFAADPIKIGIYEPMTGAMAGASAKVMATCDIRRWAAAPS